MDHSNQLDSSYTVSSARRVHIHNSFASSAQGKQHVTRHGRYIDCKPKHAVKGPQAPAGAPNILAPFGVIDHWHFQRVRHLDHVRHGQPNIPSFGCVTRVARSDDPDSPSLGHRWSSMPRSIAVDVHRPVFQTLKLTGKTSSHRYASDRSER